MHTFDRGAIERFVRQGLGCTCPDSVFDRIDVSPGPDGTGIELVIGDRLLVRAYEVADIREAQLRRWTEDGVRRRNAHGLNRFRLVLAAERPEEVAAAARAAFERLALPDERVHLHVLPREQAAVLFSAVREPSPQPTS
jgi:hypothetical protein